MIDRARRQLLALLFNVAAQYISQNEVISEDGATVSQAITFCDQLVDDPEGDHALARRIAARINRGRLVAADVIPYETPNIAYRAEPDRAPLPRLPVLDQNKPNPFNPVTKIRFVLPNADHVHLAVYAVDGRRVNVLFDGLAQQGSNEVLWLGLDEQNRPAASGTYFYRLTTAGFATTRRMVLIK